MGPLRLESEAVPAVWEQMDNVTFSIREIIDVHIPVEARGLNVDDQGIVDMCSGARGHQCQARRGRRRVFYYRL